MPELLTAQPDTTMFVALGLLLLTVVLFVSEVVRVDVAALCILALLGLTGLVPGDTLFDGFASDAVMAMVAVMIIGAGLDRTGIMSSLGNRIAKRGGRNEFKLVTMLGLAAAAVSSFIQNVAATALLLPVVSRVSTRTRMPVSRLLMPVAIFALLGGSVTLIGASPLIVLNDLIATANRSLGPDQPQLESFSLFAVTPIGLALVGAGMLYLLTLGRRLMPIRRGSKRRTASATRHYFSEIYGIGGDFVELLVTVDSPLVGMTVGEAEKLPDAPLFVGLRSNEEPRLAPPRDEMIWVGSVLGVIAPREQIDTFADVHELRVQPRLRQFGRLVNPSLAGISEVVIPPGSRLIGRTVGEERMRKRYGLAVLAINRGEEIFKENVRDVELEVGDCLVIHSQWRNLAQLADDRNFVVISDIPKEEQRPQKVPHAIALFLITLGLVLFTDIALPLALFCGAIGMVLSGVIDMDDAYRAIGWKSIFLVASLIPLGYALDHTGTASWLARLGLSAMGDAPTWLVQVVLGLLASIFGLIISNIGATILLVPLAINAAIELGADPRAFALVIALCASNNFMLPTNQVNALVLGPGNYRVSDFLRVGAPMTVIYLAVVVGGVNLLL